MMPNCDPQDRFVYPSLTLMLDSYILGEVYSWGDNDEGQLGDGTTNAIQRPRLVAALQGMWDNVSDCDSTFGLFHYKNMSIKYTDFS